MKHGLLLKVLMVIAIASMIVPSISAAPAPFSPYIQASRLEEVYEDAPMDSSWLYQIDEVKFRSIGLDPTRLYWRSQLDDRPKNELIPFEQNSPAPFAGPWEILFEESDGWFTVVAQFGVRSPSSDCDPGWEQGPFGCQPTRPVVPVPPIRPPVPPAPPRPR